MWKRLAPRMTTANTISQRRRIYSDVIFAGQTAEYIIHLGSVKERSNYTIMESDENMPFYLCKVHEYVYKKMRTSIDLKDYFDETIRIHR